MGWQKSMSGWDQWEVTFLRTLWRQGVNSCLGAALCGIAAEEGAVSEESPPAGSGCCLAGLPLGHRAWEPRGALSRDSVPQKFRPAGGVWGRVADGLWEERQWPQHGKSPPEPTLLCFAFRCQGWSLYFISGMINSVACNLTFDPLGLAHLAWILE